MSDPVYMNQIVEEFDDLVDAVHPKGVVLVMGSPFKPSEIFKCMREDTYVKMLQNYLESYFNPIYTSGLIPESYRRKEPLDDF